MTSDPVRVLMIAEGTYPYHFGGVSTWCHLLLQHTPDAEFTLMSIIGDVKAEPKFTLPKSVKKFIPIPLWGVHDILETRRDLSFMEIAERKRLCTEEVIASRFIPLFEPFIEALFAGSGNPEYLAQMIHGMYCFFQRYDFGATMRSRAVWDCFVQRAQQGFPIMAAQHGYSLKGFTLADLTTGMKWVYHWLFPLASPIPKVDVVHAAMVGVSTIVAIAVKKQYNAAYLLTEHGIYLRECYLAEISSSGSLFLKLLRLRFARMMTALSYNLADQISPCCDYNKRWELRNGAPPSRLKTIYYGVDSTVFTPQSKPENDPPTVVWVGRINPLKDLDTLLRSAALVHAVRPDIKFKLFGSASRDDENYNKEIQALHTELGLADSVQFCGYTSKPQTAYNQGDLVVLSSISEAFPICILEAMLCAKPIVATAVGGVPEEIEGCGIAVEPRNPRAMADAILTMMGDPQTCVELGKVARQKAVEGFSIIQSCSAHLETYREMIGWRKAAAKELALPTPATLDLTQMWVSVPSAQTLPEPMALENDGSFTFVKVSELAEEVSRRVPLPVDAFEITALLESLGITDHVAVQRYSSDDVFSLAEAVFAKVRSAQWPH